MTGEIEYELVTIGPVAGAMVQDEGQAPRPAELIDVLQEAANAVGRQRWQLLFPVGKDQGGNMIVLMSRPKLLIHLSP